MRSKRNNARYAQHSTRLTNGVRFIDHTQCLDFQILSLQALRMSDGLAGMIGKNNIFCSICDIVWTKIVSYHQF